LACALPALQVRFGTAAGTIPGYQLLFYGWMGPLELQFAWCANFALPIAVILLLRRLWVPAAVVGAAGLLVASDTFALFFRPTAVPGVLISLTMPLIGFYLWMASFAVLLATAVIGPIALSAPRRAWGWMGVIMRGRRSQPAAADRRARQASRAASHSALVTSNTRVST
jgi:hypothetical protein